VKADRPGHRRQGGDEQAEGYGRLIRPDFLADPVGAQGENERLGDVHDSELVVRVPDRVDRATGPDLANAEQVARHPGQGRVDLRVLPLGVRLALIRLAHQVSHPLGGRQVAC
jgi:hypothetical protein